jgi:hypothetical protein
MTLQWSWPAGFKPKLSAISYILLAILVTLRLFSLTLTAICLYLVHLTFASIGKDNP